MNCTSCKNKLCRTGADCFNVKDESIELLTGSRFHDTSFSASSLIDNGRAGTLTRLQEIIEYCRVMGYERIGVAYCFGVAGLALSLERALNDAGLSPLMIQCTTGGVMEKDIDPIKTNNTVSCNPAGQAIFLKEKNVEFIIEMGLCLGHDVIFHTLTDIPFTVFLVKDRVLRHNPALALDSYDDFNAGFLAGMDAQFRMKTPEWLNSMIEAGKPLYILDLRGSEVFNTSHIAGSINVPLSELPKKYISLFPDRSIPIVALCNGSVQSAYAIMFLYSRGYREVYNLSGGFSRWEKDGYAVLS